MLNYYYDLFLRDIGEMPTKRIAQIWLALGCVILGLLWLDGLLIGLLLGVL